MKNIEALDLKDLKFIKESLEYTRLKFEEYETYPSYEYKQKRIQEAKNLLKKVSDIINQHSGSTKPRLDQCYFKERLYIRK